MTELSPAPQKWPERLSPFHPSILSDHHIMHCTLYTRRKPDCPIHMLRYTSQMFCACSEVNTSQGDSDIFPPSVRRPQC